jgi:hypothetical protein
MEVNDVRGGQIRTVQRGVWYRGSYAWMIFVYHGDTEGTEKTLDRIYRMDWI